LRDRLLSDPAGLILQLLQEQRQAMSAAEVKEQLVRLGLDAKAVAKAWTTAQKRFARLDNVRVEGRTYRWVEPAAVPPNDAPDARDVTAVQGDQSDGSADESRSGPAGETSGLVSAIAEVIGEESARSVEQFLSHPLRTAVRLGRLSESEIDRLLARLTAEDQAQALALLLGLPRRSDALDDPGRLAGLNPRTAEAALIAAAEELRDQARPGPSERMAAGWLVRRATAIDALRPAVAAPLIELAAHIARDGQGSDLEALDAAARTTGRLLPHLPPEIAQEVNIERLAAAVTRLPFAPRGGRVALLAAVGRTMPKRLADEIWWRGVTIRALADCAGGPLGSVVSLPFVAEQIVRPLLGKELAATSTRSQVSFLLGLPPELATQLPPSEVGAAVRRAASQDRLLGQWMEAFGAGERIKALQRDLERARAETAAVTERAEAGERRIQELLERCDRLEQILREEHVQAVALRASQERQIRIDVIRALAYLAAEVEELVTNRTAPDVLIERVRSLVAANALQPIGAAGAEVAFDPARHQPIVDAPSAGETVNVIRPGYCWHVSDEDIVIHKALVSPM
jgi:hypothetical protein